MTTESWTFREDGGAFSVHRSLLSGDAPPRVLIAWLCSGCRSTHVVANPDHPAIDLDRAVSYSLHYVDFESLTATYRLKHVPAGVAARAVAGRFGLALTSVEVGDAVRVRKASSGTAGGPEHPETTTGPGSASALLAASSHVPPEEDRGTANPYGREFGRTPGQRWRRARRLAVERMENDGE